MPPLEPIFITGCGKSGTSIVFRTLRQHKDLAPTTGYPDGEDHVGWIKFGKCKMSVFVSKLPNPFVCEFPIVFNHPHYGLNN